MGLAAHGNPSSASDPAEHEAYQAAQEVVGGGRPGPLGAAPRSGLSRRPGDPPGFGGDGSHAVADWIQKYAPKGSWTNAGTDLATDLIPGVSNVKDATVAITGVNPVTGEKVGVWGRIFSGVCAIPAIGNVVKWVGKAGKGLWKGGKWLGKWGGRRCCHAVPTAGCLPTGGFSH